MSTIITPKNVFLFNFEQHLVVFSLENDKYSAM